MDILSQIIHSVSEKRSTLLQIYVHFLMRKGAPSHFKFKASMKGVLKIPNCLILFREKDSSMLNSKEINVFYNCKDMYSCRVTLKKKLNRSRGQGS